jgi:hypothetical protein
MDSAPDISSHFGSVGWIVDRTSQNRQVLGTVWLVRSQVAVTCTHVLIPYFDVPEALGVDFPHVGKRFSVKEIMPHSFYDPWLIRRKYQQPQIFPPHGLSVETNNLSALVLNPAPPPLERSTVDKVARLMKRSMPEEEATLAGSATQVQITSIIQTLLSNRSNQGTLTLFDTNNNPIAKFYLRENQLTHVRFGHLFNEEALYRLLTLVEEETFQFTFIYDYDPEWAKFPPVQKSTAGLLLDAYTRLETYQQIKNEFNNNLNIVISQAVPTLNLDPLPLEIRPAVACTWNHLRHGIPMQRLLKACNFDGSTILYALKYLRETGQIKGLDKPPASNIEPSKLMIANNCSLERGTPISAITIDPDTRLPVVETGFILDFFPDKGDGHYVHSIGLPPTAAGAPLLVNGEVVAVHCNILTEGVEPYSEWIHPSLAIAADQVYQCMDLSPQKKTTEVLAFQAENSERLTDETTLSGDYARHPEVQKAPHMTGDWARTSIAQEELAGSTGQHGVVSSQSPRDRRAEDRARASGEFRPVDLAQPADQSQQSSTGSFKKKSGFFESIGSMFKGKGGSIESDTVEVNLLRQGLDGNEFKKIPTGTPVRKGDLVRIRLRLLANTYAAVLLRLNGEETVRLIYPETPAHEEPLLKGHIIDFPTQFTEASSVGRKNVLVGIPINSADGFDEIIVLTGLQPLVVRLFELGPDRVFNLINKSLGEETTGRFYVNRMEIAKATPETADSPNMFSVCILELIHSD